MAEIRSATGIPVAGLFCAHSPQKNIAYLAGDGFRVGIDARSVPRVQPVHHSEKSQDRRARADSTRPSGMPPNELQPFSLYQILHQSDANAVVFTLNSGQFVAI